MELVAVLFGIISAESVIQKTNFLKLTDPPLNFTSTNFGAATHLQNLHLPKSPRASSSPTEVC